MNRTMEQAVQTLGQQSSQWQSTLINLERQLADDALAMEEQIARDVNQLVEKVDFLVRDGVQFTQESINCQGDIIGVHVRIGLQNLLNEFLNAHNYKGKNDRPMLPYEPTVCTLNPTAIEIFGWQGVSGQLVMSGVDFNILDTEQPLAYVRSNMNTEKVVPAFYVARQTNYRIAINVAAMIGDGFFEDGSRQLEIRWEGRRVNPNQINIVPAPPPPTCGNQGQPCCTTGASCDRNLTCISNRCSTPPPPPAPVTSIVLTIRTADVEDAGTDATTIFTLGGNQWRLDTPEHDDFERGNTDSFNLTPIPPGMTVNASALNPMQIFHGSDGSWWKFTRVTLTINGVVRYNNHSLNVGMDGARPTWTANITTAPL